MNSARKVTEMVAAWKTEGKGKAAIVWGAAEACLGWPYAWGALGQNCTPGNRRACMNRSSIADGDRELIRKRCQILNGSDSSCTNCKYYPGGEVTRIHDCRGFTRKMLELVGITLQGAGATSQWNSAANWTEKGLIRDMPTDKLCCVFQKNPNNEVMEHTGFGLGDQIIHCSVEVKRGHTYDKGWTHYAVIKGADGDIPIPEPSFPTIRKGARGEYVTLAQTKLIQQGYDVGRSGADGIFGTATDTAVRKYQADHGLKSDGIIGPATWESLNDGKAVYYKVSLSHVSKSVAEEIIGKYGGVMTKEE